MTDFVFVADENIEEGEANAMTGQRSKAGRLYVVGNEPKGHKIRVLCCARQARRYRMGLTIDDFNYNLKRLKYGRIEFF